MTAVNIILLGPPGAGKGTQARVLIESRAMVQLSTGDMLREARASGSDMGRTVAAVMDKGNLVTDEIVIGLIHEQLTSKHPAGGFIFDGFPRTLAQADALGALMAEIGQTIAHVIAMQVDDEVLVGRVSGRATCASCGEVYHDQTRPIPADGHCTHCGGTRFTRRADDNAESLRTRLLAYYKQTSPLIGYYHAKGQLCTVDGLADIPVVSAALAAILDS